MTHWWIEEEARFLDECLAHINFSRKAANPVASCRCLFDALNKTWDSFYAFRKKQGESVANAAERSDHADIRDLLLMALEGTQLSQFCRSEHMQRLAVLEPQVMNHDTLRRREYTPSSISPELAQEARAEHRQLANAYTRYIVEPENEALRTALLKKTAQLLYIVRSNIAHGEKTPRGPDRKKVQRDRDVCNRVLPVLDQFFQLLFDQPNHRLALYGTLRPGESNHQLIEDISGHWIKGETRGGLSERNSYPIFVWSSSGEPVKVEILVSTKLPEELPRIDEFEGSDYERIWIPVQTTEGLQICNIYSDSTS